jgi:uroporphyrinogen-III synthase
MRLLITRPEPDNKRTAAMLRAQGHDVLLAPLLHIETTPDADLGTPPWAAVLFTSVNGVRALADHPRRGELLGLPVLAVGQSSADAARAAGFADVTSADGDAGDLARLAAQRFAGAREPLLYLAGADRSGEMAVPGQTIRTVVLYRAAPAERLPAAAQTALQQGRIEGVLHFSRRSAESYLACSRDMLGTALKPVHYCLSARVAEPLRRAGASRIAVAAHADEASLVALVTPKPSSNRLE